jgi:U3 small nucleolar RNA-associated protein 23
MRILKNKRNRKLLHLYRTLHGVAPPYTVIVDGTFLHAARRCTLDLYSLIPRLLQVDPSMVTLLVPTSSIEELRALGEVGAETLELALTFETTKYGKGDSPSAVIANLIGDRNRKHYVVATQDAALRSELRKTPGVPQIYLNRTVLVLEPMSYASQNRAAAQERQRSAPTKSERRAMAPAAGEGRNARRKRAAAAASFSGGGGATPAAAASDAGSAPRQRKKRKGPKGANPLSMKRKKEKKQPAPTAKPSSKKGRRRGGRSGAAGAAVAVPST